MNSRVIRSSTTRQLHALYTECIKPKSTTPHLNTFGLTSLGHSTRRSGNTHPHPITPLSTNNKELETKNNTITKKFVFHKSKITQLKAMAAVRGVHNPTPVHVLSELIFKCAKAASTHESVARSPLFQLLDNRPKVGPQSPKRCVGDLRALKEQITKRKMELNLCKENVKVDEIIKTAKNMIVLKDAPSGECIEALITLEKGHMTTFQQHKQLLQFASL